MEWQILSVFHRMCRVHVISRGVCDQWLVLGSQYNTVSTNTKAGTSAGIQVDTIRVLDQEDCS